MSFAVASISSASIFASGTEAPLVIAIPIIVAVVLMKVLFARRRGRPVLGGKVVVRCSKGHLFTTTWSPLGSLTSIRLGFARFQRCPVGNHWALVKAVSNSELTDEDRRIAAENGG